MYSVGEKRIINNIIMYHINLKTMSLNDIMCRVSEMTSVSVRQLYRIKKEFENTSESVNNNNSVKEPDVKRKRTYSNTREMTYSKENSCSYKKYNRFT